eukprot:GHVU01111159.1.p1 GENE.GHVU01111159.1~~GHVU01111159.1.p1  ORF type:complete len:338 (+),score=47.31 GHVU01111159.1:84-1016(+)
MYADETLEGEARATAGGYHDALCKLENAFMTGFWADVLCHVNAATLLLQKPQLTLNEAVNVYRTLLRRINRINDRFDHYETAAMMLCGTKEYQRRRQAAATRHNTQREPLDYGNASSAVMTARQRFRVDGFVCVMDHLMTFLRDRLAAYEELADNWGFLQRLRKSSDDALTEAGSNLVTRYPDDFSDKLPGELVDFRHFVAAAEDGSSRKQEKGVEQYMYDLLLDHDLADSFPNINNLLVIYLCMMVSNAGCERSFSKLKRVKADNRSSMNQERLVSLARMSLESDILRTVDFSDIVKEFASQKARRVPL